MARQIIKQPNGKYCLFSSTVDNVIIYDAEPKEIIDFFIEEESEKIQLKVDEIISKLDNGTKPYYQFTMTYEEMKQKIKEIHGIKELKNIEKFCENK